MLALKNTVVLLGFLTTATIAVAQKPKPVGRTATVQKFKPPKLKSSLGTRSDSVNVSVDEAVAIITLPINITDDKKSAYTISSYQCMYKRKGVTENEENGKVSPTTSVVANLFSTTPIHERIKRMEASGVIKQYATLVDHTKVKKSLIAICYVSLKEHSKTAGTKFVKSIMQMPDVVECYTISGEFDFMLKVMTEDMNAYHDFHVNKLSNIDNMGHVQSVFVMGVIKDTHVLVCG